MTDAPHPIVLTPEQCAEREACAQAAESAYVGHAEGSGHFILGMMQSALRSAARRIRARSESDAE